MSAYSNLAVIILAAGKGTRMKSDKAKVLHKVAGKSMVCHVVECALKLAVENVHVVVGHQAEQVKKEVDEGYHVNYALQSQLLGTGDAVKAALPGLDKDTDNVLVLCGDVPLIQEETLSQMVRRHVKMQSHITVLATDVEDPTGYGRIVLDADGQMKCIREEADASNEEKKIKKVNTGIYCFDKDLLVDTIDEVKPDNNQAEYYLTDLVEIAQIKGKKIGVVTMSDSRQVVGVNTLEDLANAESLILELGK